MNILEKPTLILIPGAWHTPAHLAPLSDRLRAQSYRTRSVHLPSTTTVPGVTSITPDASAVRSVIVEELDTGRDVVLVCHSHGAMPACDAVQGLRKEDREREGKKGGVLALVFIAGFVLDVGVTPHQGFGGDLSWFDFKPDNILLPLTPEKYFYSDLSPDAAAHWASKLEHFSHGCFTSAIAYAAWKHLPVYYIATQDDMTVPYPMQQAMLQAAEREGGEFEVLMLKSGHCPHLSHPDEVLAFVRRAAGETGGE